MKGGWLIEPISFAVRAFHAKMVADKPVEWSVPGRRIIENL
jgi:hypothetical protein